LLAFLRNGHQTIAAPVCIAPKQSNEN